MLMSPVKSAMWVLASKRRAGVVSGRPFCESSVRCPTYTVQRRYGHTGTSRKHISNFETQLDSS